MSSRKIIFFGYSGILIPAIQWLESNRHAYAIYATAGQAIKVKDDAIRVNTIASLEDFRFSEIEKLSEYIGISVGAPWRFSESFIRKFSPDKLLNLHGTYLPQLRGGNIYSWFVLNGIRTGICLLHRVIHDFDAGPVIQYEEFLYPGSCRKPIDYMNHYEQVNGDFLMRFITDFCEGHLNLMEFAQPTYLSSYWPRLKSDVNGWINWEMEGHALNRFISAFDEPYDGARTRFRGKVVSLKDVSFQPGFCHHPFQYGIVFRKTANWLHVAVCGGELIVSCILNENKESLFHKIKEGDRFITLVKDLEQGKRRVIKRINGMAVQSDIE